MPEWLQVLSTIIAATFTVGMTTRGLATWVLTNTIKRDIKDLREEIARVSKRIDDWDGSEVWNGVQIKVGNIETDAKLIRQSLGYCFDRVTTLEHNFNVMRERRHNDYRKES